MGKIKTKHGEITDGALNAYILKRIFKSPDGCEKLTLESVIQYLEIINFGVRLEIKPVKAGQIFFIDIFKCDGGERIAHVKWVARKSLQHQSNRTKSEIAKFTNL